MTEGDGAREVVGNFVERLRGSRESGLSRRLADEKNRG